MVERLADFGFQFWKREKSFMVKLAAHGGKSLEDVTFLVRRRSSGGGRRIEIEVQR